MNSSYETKTIRKIACRTIPILALMFTVCFIDRVNIGFAALTMNKDLGFSSGVYGLGAGIFFLGYFIFQVPSNLILNKIGARIWLPCMMITWSLISGAMALINDATSFYIVRFFLGVAEAGLYPGAILYISYWFPSKNRATMAALFGAGATFGIAIGSVISGALMEMHGLFGLRNWQLMFLLEAIPSVLLGIVSFFFLTSRPEDASWLAEDERNWLVKTLMAEETAKKETASCSIWIGIFDVRVLALSFVYFGLSATLYALGLWAPLMIKTLGFSPIEIGFLNSGPAIIGLIAVLLYSWHSDRTGERTWHVVIACLIGAVGFVLACSMTSVVSVIVALTLIHFGSGGPKGALWSMPTMFLSGPAVAAGIATINAIGNLGGFFGPAIIGYIKQTTGNFTYGLYAVGATLALSAVIMLLTARLYPMEPAPRKVSLASSNVAVPDPVNLE